VDGQGPNSWRAEAHRAILLVLADDFNRRRASPKMLALWAVMAGQAETPRATNSEGFTDSTDSGGRNGCNTDGA
jgi:hypothetical protein